MSLSVDEGPYMNEDGDWWVPVTVPYLEARKLVKGCAYSNRLSYKGRESVLLDPCHEAGDGECDVAATVVAWHFFEEEPA